MTWDPQQYLRFSNERDRPFYELVSRIEVDPDSVRRVVDLGCGTGHLTASLLERWRNAQVLGVDADADMLRTASAHASERLTFLQADIADLPDELRENPADVVVSNATYQWLLDHLDRMPSLLELVRPGGWFAFQVPGNLDDPHHLAIRALRAQPRWAGVPAIAALPPKTHVSFDPTDYLSVLAPFCDVLDSWATTYVHILKGPDPVLEWVKGTGLRPVLEALQNEADQAEFLAELAPKLRAAYPAASFGTPFPFRRVFVVVRRR